jgi:hypothetical protein
LFCFQVQLWLIHSLRLPCPARLSTYVIPRAMHPFISFRVQWWFAKSTMSSTAADVNPGAFHSFLLCFQVQWWFATSAISSTAADVIPRACSSFFRSFHFISSVVIRYVYHAEHGCRRWKDTWAEIIEMESSKVRIVAR